MSCRQVRVSSVHLYRRTISISFGAGCAKRWSCSRSAWTIRCRRASYARFRLAAKTCQARHWEGRAAVLFRWIHVIRRARRPFRESSRSTSNYRPIRQRRPRSEAAPMSALTMSGSLWDNRFGGGCGSSCSPAFRLETGPMLVARRQPRAREAGFLPANTPYVEQADRRESRFDSVMLNAWGQVSPLLLSGFERRRWQRLVRSVGSREKQLADLSDRHLRQTADELRASLVSATVKSEAMSLAFALAREAARRHTGMRHFHVQLLGGAAMMGGRLAEMQPGEGKTLTALLPAVAAGLMGRPVHIVTVNDYLARRDSEQLRPVYDALGLTTGLVEHGQQHQQRQQAYSCDVVYCANKELVFDYLRDRLALGTCRARARLLIEDVFRTSGPVRSQHLLLRGLQFAIVDEADSVLVDEARTPLILSGVQQQTESDAELYETALAIARRLTFGEHYHLLPREKTVRLTSHG